MNPLFAVKIWGPSAGLEQQPCEQKMDGSATSLVSEEVLIAPLKPNEGMHVRPSQTGGPNLYPKCDVQAMVLTPRFLDSSHRVFCRFYGKIPLSASHCKRVFHSSIR